MSSLTTWINVYIDGQYYRSGPPTSFTWSSTSVANGTHTISARAYAAGSILLQSTGISVNVMNQKATPTRTRTPTRTATRTATRTPTPASTPTPILSGTSYFFATAGSDSSPCTLTLPCWSLPKAQTVIAHAKPGDSIRFARGNKWPGGITLPAHLNGAAGKPITIGNYG